MRLAGLGVVFLSIVALAACTSVPREGGYPYTSEQNMRSAYHWEELAKKVVNTQVVPLFPPSVNSKVPPSTDKVYVDDSDRTNFGRALHGYLLTALVNHGIEPAHSPEDATYILKWGTQLVYNSKPGVDFPGVLVGTVELVGAALIGTSFLQSPSCVEVIFTSQVNRGRYIISRKDYNFYINYDNKWNFWEPERLARK